MSDSSESRARTIFGFAMANAQDLVIKSFADEIERAEERARGGSVYIVTRMPEEGLVDAHVEAVYTLQHLAEQHVAADPGLRWTEESISSELPPDVAEAVARYAAEEDDVDEV